MGKPGRCSICNANIYTVPAGATTIIDKDDERTHLWCLLEQEIKELKELAVTLRAEISKLHSAVVKGDGDGQS